MLLRSQKLSPHEVYRLSGSGTCMRRYESSVRRAIETSHVHCRLLQNHPAEQAPQLMLMMDMMSLLFLQPKRLGCVASVEEKDTPRGHVPTRSMSEAIGYPGLISFLSLLLSLFSLLSCCSLLSHCSLLSRYSTFSLLLLALSMLYNLQYFLTALCTLSALLLNSHCTLLSHCSLLSPSWMLSALSLSLSLSAGWSVERRSTGQPLCTLTGLALTALISPTALCFL